MYFCNILSNKPAQNMSLLDSKNQSNHTRTNGIWGHGLRCLYNHLYIIITRCLEQPRFPTVTHWDWFWNCTWDPFCCLRLLAFHQSHQNFVAHNTYKLDKIFKAFEDLNIHDGSQGCFGVVECDGMPTAAIHCPFLKVFPFTVCYRSSFDFSLHVPYLRKFKWMSSTFQDPSKVVKFIIHSSALPSCSLY